MKQQTTNEKRLSTRRATQKRRALYFAARLEGVPVWFIRATPSDLWTAGAFYLFDAAQKAGIISYNEIEREWTAGTGAPKKITKGRLAYFCVGAMRDIFQQVGLGFQELYNLGPDQEVPYLTYEQWSNLVRNTTDQIIAEQNLQPMIDEVWNARTPEDYSEYYSKVKAAFEAEWHHSRTKAGKGMQSLERLMETSDGRRQILALSDESDFAEEDIYRLWSQRFLETLPPKDRKILQLKTAGFTVQEIAERAGYKTHSAVVKRLRKIREKFEGFILSGS